MELFFSKIQKNHILKFQKFSQKSYTFIWMYHVFYMCVKSDDEIHYGESYTKKTNSCIFNTEQCVYCSLF